MPHSCPMWSPTCEDSVRMSDRGSGHPTPLVSAVGVRQIRSDVGRLPACKTRPDFRSLSLTRMTGLVEIMVGMRRPPVVVNLGGQLGRYIPLWQTHHLASGVCLSSGSMISRD